MQIDEEDLDKDEFDQEDPEEFFKSLGFKDPFHKKLYQQED